MKKAIYLQIDDDTFVIKTNHNGIYLNLLQATTKDYFIVLGDENSWKTAEEKFRPNEPNYQNVEDNQMVFEHYQRYFIEHKKDFMQSSAEANAVHELESLHTFEKNVPLPSVH